VIQRQRRAYSFPTKVDSHDALATFKTQSRFPPCIEQRGRVVKAARWSGVPRALHYRWLDEDPTYPGKQV
jgi:hypothetical protein